MPNTARSATILEEEEEEVVVRACDSTRRIPRRMDKEFGRSPRSETKDGASRGKQKSYQPNSTVTKPPWMTGRPAAHGLDAYPEGVGGRPWVYIGRSLRLRPLSFPPVPR